MMTLMISLQILSQALTLTPKMAYSTASDQAKILNKKTTSLILERKRILIWTSSCPNSNKLSKIHSLKSHREEEREGNNSPQSFSFQKITLCDLEMKLVKQKLNKHLFCQKIMKSTENTAVKDGKKFRKEIIKVYKKLLLGRPRNCFLNLARKSGDQGICSLGFEDGVGKSVKRRLS